MNIQLNTNNFNTQYNYKNNYNKKSNYSGYKNNNMSFTGGNPIDALPVKSKFLDPFKRAFDKFTTFIADKYTTKVYTSKLAQWLAKHTEKLGSVVDHMQVAGSVIISSMYMSQTLRNKEFDDDRKKTLAINQGLTLAVSTLGSYLIDSSLDNVWENFTQKYAANRLQNSDLSKKIKEINDGMIKEAEETFKKPWKKIGKHEHVGEYYKPELMTTLKYVEKYVKDSNLESKLRGMGVLKKLLVFGTVYRFISPVAVTPLASKLGDKLANSDKKKAEEQKKTAA